METENKELREILEKQNLLLQDNNKILHKLHRYEMINFWTKIFWYALLIGAPFALYYYLLEPYFETLGASYEIFSAGLHEIPGLKQLEEVVNTYKAE